MVERGRGEEVRGESSAVASQQPAPVPPPFASPPLPPPPGPPGWPRSSASLLGLPPRRHHGWYHSAPWGGSGYWRGEGADGWLELGKEGRKGKAQLLRKALANPQSRLGKATGGAGLGEAAAPAPLHGEGGALGGSRLPPELKVELGSWGGGGTLCSRWGGRNSGQSKGREVREATAFSLEEEVEGAASEEPEAGSGLEGALGGSLVQPPPFLDGCRGLQFPTPWFSRSQPFGFRLLPMGSGSGLSVSP
ncbi:uncharacterized protein LOC127561578 [Antechinus flavipes]|uniref:uncharacterized protein LOC127561578 n=1 Tax=Antechinus flavipes TaxID=38775 RepID=UPI002236354C|nr:uncharacterized protein LOC127561578 [Antechinus flavipes]